MRFHTPPGWPDAPKGWIPDPGWRPDPAWPTAPAGWAFWTNDYDIAIDAPAGLYPRTRASRRPKVLLATGAGLAGLFLGIAAGGQGASGSGASLAALPAPTVVTSTLTLVGPPVTTTVTTPVTTTVTSVAPAPTVTRVVRTTVTAAAGLADTGGTGSGGGSVYYASCAAARAAGVAPLYAGEPGYRSGLDRDHDGVACE